jgi:hypothetical protein
MAGKIKRKLIDHAIGAHNTAPSQLQSHVCPLCEREIPTAQRDAHHLIPKSKGGRETQFLHRICHRQIHALFTENELANHYHSVENLLQHAEMLKFVAWIKTKPNHFIERTRKSQRIRPK